MGSLYIESAANGATRTHFQTQAGRQSSNSEALAFIFTELYTHTLVISVPEVCLADEALLTFAPCELPCRETLPRDESRPETGHEGKGWSI